MGKKNQLEVYYCTLHDDACIGTSKCCECSRCDLILLSLTHRSNNGGWVLSDPSEDVTDEKYEIQIDNYLEQRCNGGFYRKYIYQLLDEYGSYGSNNL